MVEKKRDGKPLLKVRIALFESGLTYPKTAKKLGISLSAFNARMQGRVAFSIDQAARISHITGKPLDDLFCLNGCIKGTEVLAENKQR